MTSIRILLIGSVCTLMLCVSGCSGGRLRNLTAGSDYRTLDELEKSAAVEAERAEADQRQEALAKAAETADATVAVSKEREVPETEEAAAEETQLADASGERRRFLGFVNPFRRASATEAVSPDPFVEPTEAQAAAESTEVLTASKTETPKAAAASATEQPTATDSVADKFESTTIAEVEKQAESMFEEAAVKQEFSAADVAAAEAKPSAGSDELSFAEFLQQTQPKAEPLVAAEKTVSAEKTVAAVQTTTSQAATDDSFDAFMQKFGEEPSASVSTAAAETQVAAADPESAFSAFDIAKQTESPLVAKVPSASPNPFAEEVVVATEAAAAAPEINPFEETAQKHGFTRSQQDPWAAFAATQNQAAETPSASRATPSFAWSNAPEAAAIDERSQKLANLTQETHPTTSESRSPFQAASFSKATELRVPSVDSIPEVHPLVIPGGSTSDAARSPFQEATSFQHAQPHVQHDAHLTAVPFDQLQPAVADATAEPAAITSPETASSWQWSGRTWFLLLGCIIVCVLLFMPDRRNRHDA